MILNKTFQLKLSHLIIGGILLLLLVFLVKCDVKKPVTNKYDKEKKEIEARQGLMVARIQREKTYNQFDRDFMRESAVSETNCFESLIMTKDTSRLFAKHPSHRPSHRIVE